MALLGARAVADPKGFDLPSFRSRRTGWPCYHTQLDALRTGRTNGWHHRMCCKPKVMIWKVGLAHLYPGRRTITESSGNAISGNY
jgi:hypothetical protein